MFKQYTMFMTKLQLETDQLALTIVKIRNAPQFEGTYKLWVIVLLA